MTEGDTDVGELDDVAGDVLADVLLVEWLEYEDAVVLCTFRVRVRVCVTVSVCV